MPKPMTNPCPFPPNNPCRLMFGLAYPSIRSPCGRPGIFGLVVFFFLYMKISLCESNLPWVLIVFPRVYRYHTLRCNTTFADWAYHCLSGLIHPGIDALPAIKMTTSCDNWLFSSLEANVTLEHGVPTIVSLGRLLLLFFCFFNWTMFGLLTFFKRIKGGLCRLSWGRLFLRFCIYRRGYWGYCLCFIC